MRLRYDVKMALVCCDCKQERDENAFSKKANCKRGFHSKCKDCHNTYVREVWYPKNVQKQIASSSKWKKENPAKVLAQRHSLRLEDVEEILQKSNNCCQLCKSTHNLHFDHCHATNKARGILCVSCNTLIGKLGDSYISAESRMKDILNYLEPYK